MTIFFILRSQKKKNRPPISSKNSSVFFHTLKHNNTTILYSPNEKNWWLAKKFIQRLNFAYTVCVQYVFNEWVEHWEMMAFNEVLSFKYELCYRIYYAPLSLNIFNEMVVFVLAWTLVHLTLVKYFFAVCINNEWKL